MMARKSSPTLTDAEQRIMRVLWNKGEASVRDVADELNRSRNVAYTTVMTMMGILADKRFAAFRKEGRAFIYRPKITERQARTQALKHVIGQFFGGSPEALAQHLITEDQIDLAEIEALQRQLDEKGRERRK